MSIERYINTLMFITEKTRLSLKKKTNGSHALMFHKIGEKNPADYSINMMQLEDIIVMHEKRGYQFESIDEWQNHPRLKKKVIVTFDDGYSSILQALDYLTMKGIPFCVYITTSFIGKDGYLSEKQISELAQNPLCTIGNHTHYHKYANTYNDKELCSEIIKSNDYLKSIIGKQIKHFAFPYGTFVAVSIKNIKTIKRMRLFKTIALTYGGDIRKSISGIFLRIDGAREDLSDVI